MVDTLAIFEGKQIRRHWDEARELWYLSIVDVVAAMTDSQDPRNYWKVLKSRLKDEGSEVVTKCNQLKLIIRDKLESVTGKSIISQSRYLPGVKKKLK